MNKHLVDFINNKITAASKFVTNYMPVDVTIDDAYEALLACSSPAYSEATKDHMIKAFHDAVQYLIPQANYKRFNVTLDERVVSMQVRFSPTDKWPVFLMPSGALGLAPESKLVALMEVPVRVATEWEALSYVWSVLVDERHGLSSPTLAYLMPWIREVLADFDTTQLPVEVKQAERKAIDREVATIMRDTTVSFYPRLSKELTSIARSGRTLFGQYRMLEAAYNHDTLTLSPITVECTRTLLATWLGQHMGEAMDEWQEDKRERLERALDKVMTKTNSGE